MNEKLTQFTARLYGSSYISVNKYLKLEMERDKVEEWGKGLVGVGEEREGEREVSVLKKVLLSHQGEDPITFLTVRVEMEEEQQQLQQQYRDQQQHQQQHQQPLFLDPIEERVIEGKIVGKIVQELKRAPFKEKTTCFIVTPHRSQRTIIQGELRGEGREKGEGEKEEGKLEIRSVDTVERVQGGEAG